MAGCYDKVESKKRAWNQVETQILTPSESSSHGNDSNDALQFAVSGPITLYIPLDSKMVSPKSKACNEEAENEFPLEPFTASNLTSVVTVLYK